MAAGMDGRRIIGAGHPPPTEPCSISCFPTWSSRPATIKVQLSLGATPMLFQTTLPLGIPRLLPTGRLGETAGQPPTPQTGGFSAGNAGHNKTGEVMVIGQVFPKRSRM